MKRLKILKEYLDAIKIGRKTFEVREGKLRVREGEILELQCIETGETIKVRARYVFKTKKLAKYYGEAAGDLTVFSIEMVEPSIYFTVFRWIRRTGKLLDRSPGLKGDKETYLIKLHGREYIVVVDLDPEAPEDGLIVSVTHEGNDIWLSKYVLETMYRMRGFKFTKRDENENRRMFKAFFREVIEGANKQQQEGQEV